VVALGGCDSPTAYFDIQVDGFQATPGCNPRPEITGFVLDIGPAPNNYNECLRGPCARARGESFDCVAGYETPPVTPGEPIHLRLGLYVDGTTLAACASGGKFSVEDGDTIVLDLACAPDNCRPVIPMPPACEQLEL